MEQSNQISGTWREIALIAPMALLLHGAAWCFWWGVEGRETVISSAKPVAISTPAPRAHRLLASNQILVTNAKKLVVGTQPGTH